MKHKYWVNYYYRSEDGSKFDYGDFDSAERLNDWKHPFELEQGIRQHLTKQGVRDPEIIILGFVAVDE